MQLPPTTAETPRAAGSGAVQSGGADRYALLSVAAALVTIILKGAAYFLTGSVGLLSDAAESLVNLAAALTALWALRLAKSPADEGHAFGHHKAEYFASGLEGLLILVAAALIAVSAVDRLLHPRPVERLGLGLLLSSLAAVVNGAVAMVLFAGARKLKSIALRADAQHLLTDVWTTLAVLVGLFLVKFTGWTVLDPIAALLVAANIVRIGVSLVLETGQGLLDAAIPKTELDELDAILRRHKEAGVDFHALRTRVSGSKRFIELHVLVPGEWTVQRGHDLCEVVEKDIAAALPHSSIVTHLEPLEDPVAWDG